MDADITESATLWLQSQGNKIWFDKFITELFSGNIILLVVPDIYMENNLFLLVKWKHCLELLMDRNGDTDVPWEFQNKGVS